MKSSQAIALHATLLLRALIFHPRRAAFHVSGIFREIRNATYRHAYPITRVAIAITQ